MQSQHVKLLLAVANAIVETVREAGPEGAPAGPMYLAFAGHGMSLEHFERICDALVNARRLRRIGHCYHIAS